MPKVLHNMGYPPSGDNSESKIVIPDNSDFVAYATKGVGANGDMDDEFEPVVIETPQEKATREANTILEKAEHEADKIVANATKQAEQLKQAAQTEGYETAFNSQLEAITTALHNAAAVLNKIDRAQDSFINEYEKSIGKFAIEIARSILKRQIEIDPLALCDMAESAVAEIKEAKWAVLSLSKELVPLVELLHSELPEKCPSIGKLEITGLPIDSGSCIIDTPQGMLDASIEAQLRNLAQRFEQVRQKRGAK